MAGISVENLGKRYNIRGPRDRTLKSNVLDLVYNRRKKKDFWALREVNFSVSSGETLGIIGPNGAGKSTMLGLIAGTITPTEGRVEVKGALSTLLELGAGFHPDLTGRENVYLNGSILGLSRKEVCRRFPAIVEFAELEEFIDMPVKHYSSGMYVRLGFAIAVEVDPDVLLIDEVLAVGDAMFRRKCLRKIADFQKRKKAMLIVSHDMDTIKKISGRILLLDEGKVIELGNPSDIVEEYIRLGLYRKGELIIKEWGNREIEIEKAELYNKEGKKSQRFITNSSVSIRIYYNAKKKVMNPVFGFSVSDSEGRLCYGTNTLIEEYGIDYVEGRGVMNLNLNSLSLLQGRYYLSFSIHSADHKTNYHRQDNWYVFWVDPNKQAEGFLNIPCRWELARISHRIT